MDSVHQFLPTSMFNLYVLLITLCLVVMWRRRANSGSKTSRTGTNLPQADGAWPIIGHLPLLGGPELPHRSLGAMADKHGPVFTIRIGVHNALVVSSWQVAKECYTTNDKIFASRPSQAASVIMGYDHAMFNFAPYGAYWRDLRKIMMFELLSNSRLELLKHVRDSEIDLSVKELYDACTNQNRATGSPVELKKWFGDLSLNVILRMIAGKRYFGATSACDKIEATRCTNAMRDFMRLMGVFMVEDALPYLSWLDLQGYKKQMKHTFKELDSLFQGWLEEHQSKKLAGEAKGVQDFMDVLMSSLENSRILKYNNDTDTIIKATCLSIIVGGGDTTMLTLTWILSLLLNNIHVLKKAQEELDIHVGRDRRVNESDMNNLVYLQAVIKESLRLYPAGPLSGPRIATADCTLAGYHVPAGTHLLVNLWKIQRDPSVWSDPSEFRPERFLNERADMDIKGQNFEFTPFSSGRRACPGVSFSLQVMPLIMAHLLQGFELKTQMDMPVDMSEAAGLTIVKATPLDVLITSRLPSQLYEFTK